MTRNALLYCHTKGPKGHYENDEGRIGVKKGHRLWPCPLFDMYIFVGVLMTRNALCHTKGAKGHYEKDGGRIGVKKGLIDFGALSCY